MDSIFISTFAVYYLTNTLLLLMNLKITDLSFRYSRKRPEVLSGFNMELTEGGVCGLLGPNGVGKSTLLYLIAGALTPGNGRVTFEGIDTRRREPQTLASIFLVPEEVTLPPLSLEKFVSLRSPLYPEFDSEVLRKCLGRFGITEISKLHALSMGQKKKVFLSFALACRTKILLLDEPTNGLDIPGKAAFRALVAELVDDEHLFIISTHQVRDLDRILDSVLIMNARKLLISSSMNDIQNHFSFACGVYPAPEDALYAIPAPNGFDVMTRNQGFDDSEVNLELLFGYALEHPDILAEYLTRETVANNKSTFFTENS